MSSIVNFDRDRSDKWYQPEIDIDTTLTVDDVTTLLAIFVMPVAIPDFISGNMVHVTGGDIKPFTEVLSLLEKYALRFLFAHASRFEDAFNIVEP